MSCAVAVSAGARRVDLSAPCLKEMLLEPCCVINGLDKNWKGQIVSVVLKKGNRSVVKSILFDQK